MIPALRQMFAPTAHAGTAVGATDMAVEDDGGFDIGASDTDASLMGGVATEPVAQDLPKVTDPKTEASLDENPDTYADGFVDAGAIFALPSPPLIEDVVTAENDTALAPKLGDMTDMTSNLGPIVRSHPNIVADGEIGVDTAQATESDGQRALPHDKLPPAPLTSMAESMFQTQIDAGDLMATGAVAIKRLIDPDMSPLVDPATDHVATDADIGPNLVTAALPDITQNLMPDLAVEGQAVTAKVDNAPLQNAAQTVASAPLTHLPAPQLAAQILLHSNAAKIGPIEVLLNPAELGHLRFEIHQKGDQVQVLLSAERPETLELLRRNAEQLQSEFRNAGFAGASLSFGQWGRSSDGQPPASFLVNSEDDFGLVAIAQSAKSPIPQDNSRNLNLRL